GAADVGQAGLAVPVEPAGARRAGDARSHGPRRGCGRIPARPGPPRVPGAAARGRAGPRRGAGLRAGPFRRAGRARGAGAPTEGAWLPVRDARPGGVPLRQPERARHPGAEAPVCRRLSRSSSRGVGGAAMTPLPAAKALDAYFLEARAKLLDLAAILD